jgi:hypothetical protein
VGTDIEIKGTTPLRGSMPGSITVAAFVFGALLILVAIVGGGFKVFGAEVSGTVGTPLRIVAGVIGTGVLLAALYPTFRENTPFGSGGENTSSANSSASNRSQLKTNYYVDEQGVTMNVGNVGNSGVIIVSQLTLHWEYKPCPKVTPATGSGAPSVMASYKYEAQLSTSDDSHVLDPRSFK